MSTLSPAMHWTIIYVDVEGFGNFDRIHRIRAPCALAFTGR